MSSRLAARAPRRPRGPSLSRRPGLRSLRTLRGACASLALVAASACGTVDTGPPTGPPMGCNASPEFFVRNVWPSYIKAANGGGCDRSDCHDAMTGHGAFRLNPVPATAPFPPSSSPTTWPDDWRANLAACLRLLNCAEPLDSQLLVVPENRAQPHPPGDVVPAMLPSAPSNSGTYTTAEDLFRAWAAAQ